MSFLFRSVLSGGSSTKVTKNTFSFNNNNQSFLNQLNGNNKSMGEKWWKRNDNNGFMTTTTRGFHNSTLLLAVPQNKPSLRVRRVRHATQRMKPKGGQPICECGKVLPTHIICKPGCKNSYATRSSPFQSLKSSTHASAPSPPPSSSSS
eukprot:TRINITY_DN6199_c0_g1_i1.p1 TRINITY_DN6199_c0_g1~~TRINITY_DN6199_c0_g1_i1.p1  ORF type:complete len:149 (+),score=53.98 TRINITY_DN6199_c0_g1_i1:123-569(+)